MQAVSIYLAIISYLTMITTVFAVYKVIKRKLRRHNNVSMLIVLTLALTTFHTAYVLYLTFLH